MADLADGSEHASTRSLCLGRFLRPVGQRAATVTAAAPQSLPAYRFVGALNEMNNHESRLTALHYHVPGEVTLLLIAVAMVAIGVTGYYAGDRVATFLMSLRYRPKPGENKAGKSYRP